ncbi:hypothetical protein DFH08DRAFT_929247 [Mycena albidolilacea]|uniref:Uncharacterized protein n=1 Tax=Mycena albidolilacea TaxID=1033008 RepID=A0AAD7AQV6_9AGAR|nr:hypothetical protein DFH08DRAFT_929247 [Mycena albidolilacea]
MPPLLLLWLLHSVTLNCPVSGHPLRSHEEPIPIPSDPDVDSRSLFNILSGCLVTVFACTWVSVHPNVPGPNQGQLALTWRRLGLMLAAVIAPELIAGFAARQFLDARWFSKKYDVSITHGFFFAMGGFVSADGHHPIVTEEQLRLCPEYVPAIRSIRVEDIEDKSKGDSLSKGLAVLQGLWFTTQCLARVQQHLPLTELEVATLAFQFVNIFIWLLWWYKPLDVQQHILLGPADELVASAEKSHRPSESYSLVGAAVVALSRNIVALLMGDYYDFNPVASTSAPSLWSTNGFSTTHPGTGETRFNMQVIARVTFVQLSIGTIFGAIHCAAWNAHFPSADEMLIWRSCALVVAATPLGVTSLFWLYTLFGGKLLGLYAPHTVWLAAKVIVNIVDNLIIAAYIFARLLLIALSFTTLRALPPSAFVDVNWTKYIPHL